MIVQSQVKVWIDLCHTSAVTFAALRNNPSISQCKLEDAAATMHLHFASVPVWHQVKYTHEDPVTGIISTVDSLYVQPTHSTKHGVVIPSRFDTTLINDGSGGVTGVLGMFYW